MSNFLLMVRDRDYSAPTDSAAQAIDSVSNWMSNLLTYTEWAIGIGIVGGVVVGISEAVNQAEAKKRTLKAEGDLAAIRKLMEEQRDRDKQASRE